MGGRAVECFLCACVRVCLSVARVCCTDPRKRCLQTAVYPPFSPAGPKGERWCWYQSTVKGGREGRPIDAVRLARVCQELGAGEILLNCVDMDGQCNGYDLALVRAVRGAVTVPVIASSGAGAPQHFSEVSWGCAADRRSTCRLADTSDPHRPTRSSTARGWRRRWRPAFSTGARWRFRRSRPI